MNWYFLRQQATFSSPVNWNFHCMMMLKSSFLVRLFRKRSLRSSFIEQQKCWEEETHTKKLSISIAFCMMNNNLVLYYFHYQVENFLMEIKSVANNQTNLTFISTFICGKLFWPNRSTIFILLIWRMIVQMYPTM